MIAPVGQVLTQAGSSPRPTRSEHNVIGLADTRNIERAALHAVAAADAGVADEIYDPVRILHDRAGRRAGLETTRVFAMHAAVLADQPLQIAFLILPFVETHQRPDGRAQIHRILVRAFEVSDFGTKVIPFHARRLAGLATDAARHIDEFCHLLLETAGRGWRHRRR
jgi:hypothetical protein